MRCAATVASSLLLPATATCHSQVTIADHNLRACSLLDFHLPSIVLYPGEQSFEDAAQSYWARNQREARASCHVMVRSSDDVQRFLYLVGTTNATFAIKSGGHSVVANTSNLDGGIVLNLQYLNHVTVHAETLLLDVGAGARWNDVYTELERSGDYLAVAGARSGSVGVSGFILGGGLSIFSGELGWACDQVTFFEVVLANGTLLVADRNSHTDLYRALKGTGSNLAVVTRFGIQLHQKPRVHVVTLQFKVECLEALTRALVLYNINASHRSGSAVVSVGSDGNLTSITLLLTHTQVFSCEDFTPFFRIPHKVTSNRHLTQREIGAYYDGMNEDGFRQSRSTITVHNDPDLLSLAAHNLLDQLLSFLSLLQEPDARGGLLLQPLTPTHLHAGLNHGGNQLGLENGPPLLLMLVELRHTKSSSDAAVTNFTSAFVSDLHQLAKKNNAEHTFRYLNYAAAGQDVFEHIRSAQNSTTTWSRLKQVKAEYDVSDVFGRLITDPFRCGA